MPERRCTRWARASTRARGLHRALAARRFASLASDADWLDLMAALARADDPARTALDRMVRWALARDARELAA